MIQLRPARTDDIPALAAIWLEAWTAGHAHAVPKALTEQRTEESFAKRLVPLIPDTTVAWDADKPVGFCALKGRALYQIMVSAAARGGGTAARLMADAVERQRARGYERISLDCAVGNDRAAAFYRKCGWTLVDTLMIELETLGAPFPLEVWRFQRDI